MKYAVNIGRRQVKHLASLTYYTDYQTFSGDDPSTIKLFCSVSFGCVPFNLRVLVIKCLSTITRIERCKGKTAKESQDCLLKPL